MGQNNLRDLLEARERNMYKKGWTPETLLTHIECQLKRMDLAANERFELQGKAQMGPKPMPATGLWNER